MTSKITATEELRRIGEAFDDSILATSPEELREEFAAQGLDVEKVEAEMDAINASAKLAGAKMRLERARDAVKAAKIQPTVVSSAERESVRAKLHDMRAGKGGNASGLMMAARKGDGLSESDEEGAVDDMAQLAALEAQDPETDGE
ncbi:hypothetical protein [Bradyrhizobium sp. AZCC 2289]|uniref:hypothetical protein n=1 Tax=Bradyrhizobium sp. AZCC 2289 TaxID=3117026 RepID=UPI002FF07753